MVSSTFLVFLSSVLLASNASVLSIDTDDTDPTTAFKGFSFAAKATPNSDKGASDNHTLVNESNMEVRPRTLPTPARVTLRP
jgi:hypothetical protein